MATGDRELRYTMTLAFLLFLIIPAYLNKLHPSSELFHLSLRDVFTDQLGILQLVSA